MEVGFNLSFSSYHLQLSHIEETMYLLAWPYNHSNGFTWPFFDIPFPLDFSSLRYRFGSCFSLKPF